ncbi:MAG: lysophospholipid acyltransferase family protein [Verrucomicrobiales bacterium]|nr:lysophospholipid acyltransferase family protein [Verrucomicrobiales bacterium]
MADSNPSPPQPQYPLKARMFGWLAAGLIRLVCLTIRYRVDDRAGILDSPPDHPMLWVFWHNRIFVMPIFYRRYLPSRKGAVLTSPSRDGAVIASAIGCFGVGSVRGSTSKRSVAGLLALKKWVNDGNDIVITPDGPRGPVYHLAPGLIKLSQATGAPILPIRVEYDSAWRFKSWDQFRVPKPFSRATVILEPLETIDPEAEGDSFEAAREHVQKILNPNDETD